MFLFVCLGGFERVVSGSVKALFSIKYITSKSIPNNGIG